MEGAQANTCQRNKTTDMPSMFACSHRALISEYSPGLLPWHEDQSSRFATLSVLGNKNVKYSYLNKTDVGLSPCQDDGIKIGLSWGISKLFFQV